MTDWEPSYIAGLNSEQKKAVLHYGSPLLILAGAGSGKTRVITVKIAYLIDSLGVNPRDILAVTFTNKAAGEMRERAVRLCTRAEDVLIRTFHSFGAWLLRRNAHVVGLDSRFSIYDDDDAVSLLKTLYPGRDRSILSRYAFSIGRAKDYCLGPKDSLAEISEDHEFPEIYGAYQEKLDRIGNSDFGDLILRSVGLLRDNPEVKKRVHDRFRVVLVDEYQDSNVAQFNLLRELASPGTYVCVVGDDDQSIYRFRGAEIHNILTFPDNFPGTEIIRLERNYRSTGSILNAASSVVANNSGRLGKTLWTENEEGRPPAVVFCEDQEGEAKFCLGLIKKEPLKETAILYRTNAQSRIFESLFLRENIPYRIVGTLRFYEREEVKDVVAFLKFLANPRDEVSFRRIVNKPARGLGDSSIEKILACLDGGGDLLRAAGAAAGSLKGKAAKSLEDFVRLCGELNRNLEDRPLREFVENLIRRSGLEEYHTYQDEIAGTQKLQNLEEVVNAAALYGPGTAGLCEFLEGIELDSAGAAEPLGAAEGMGQVTLITMHNTKGLEFDRVVVTGLEEGLFPRGGEESETEIEEERRLFYVAITRARKEVFFTHCGIRRIHGKLLSLRPSRFLRELPEGVRPEDKASSGNGGWEIGSTVYHEEHGQGMVWKKSHDNDILMIQVRFDSGRVLQFLPKYEKRLERIQMDGL
jgi:DNA helicase-2/ATP-dependent DNA helicase PcrA